MYLITQCTEFLVKSDFFIFRYITESQLEGLLGCLGTLSMLKYRYLNEGDKNDKSV
jgi:hypothetical protein